MAFDLKKIIRPNILNIKPYSSARDEYSGKEGVFLDANENPIGSVGGGKFNRYPDPYQRDLKERIAKIKRVNPENIFLGNGSDEAIDLVFRIFCEPGKDNVIICPPTYGMYRVCADINDIKVKEVILKTDYQLDVKNILASVDQSTKAIFICSPNNPTGNLMNPEDIKTILQKFDSGIVFVDEAYIDFSEAESWNQYLDLYPNLVVIQTFSKAWGLAGLRLGMAFASEEIISFYNKVKYPYNIGLATMAEAHKALDDSEKVFDFVDEINIEKGNLMEVFAQIPAIKNVIPSDANSVLIFLVNATDIYKKLINKLVIVRDRSNVTLCKDSLRITVGTEKENEKLIKALKELI